MIQEDSFHIYPIAESAITIEYGKEITISNNQWLLKLQQHLHKQPFIGFTDTSITYNTLTVFFDPRSVFSKGQHSPLAFVLKQLEDLVEYYSSQPNVPINNGTHHLIPVCYEFSMGPDLNAVADFHQSDPESIITAHCAQDWYVFMIGFNPGFSYMGILPENLAMPRKSTPAQRVVSGSVGIAGRQTGIYPNDTPGGWQIIGRTPQRVFSAGDNKPCLLQAGDTVRFTRIDLDTFRYLNQYANT